MGKSWEAEIGITDEEDLALLTPQDETVKPRNPEKQLILRVAITGNGCNLGLVLQMN